MLLTPRSYSLSKIPDAGHAEAHASYFVLSQSRTEQRREELRARSMLLLHQTGSVKVGEVVRYACRCCTRPARPPLPLLTY